MELTQMEQDRIATLARQSGMKPHELLRTALDHYERRLVRPHGNKGRPSIQAKPVQQINIQTGKVVNEFSSMTLAGKAVNGDQASIRRAIREEGTAFGYKWRYA